MTLSDILHFIKKQKTAFIASVDEAGYPNQKAMFAPRKIEGVRTFYFSTNTSSMRVAQFRANPKASLYFYQRGARCTGVMLLGTMEVLESPALKRALWKPTDRIYYPKGVEDPDYCVLKFTADAGRWYCDLHTESFDF